MNINGLNAPGRDGTAARSMFTKLLADYHVVALQETKFTTADRLRVVSHYINSADSRSQVFWSHRDDADFTGRDGVALVLSGAHPLKNVADVTTVYAPADSFANYLVVEATLGSCSLFIHVVYAPVQVPARKRFFASLPTQFPDEACHLILGDLNVPLDPLLDECIPYPHDLGRDELQSWMLELGVLDPWRATFPDRRVFSGPNQRNRIDYCLLSPTLYDLSYRSSRYVTDKRWYHEDHYPLEFRLASPSMPTSKRLPWKCPRWLLKVPIVAATLEGTLNCLCDRLRWFQGNNPGVLLDDHKEADRAFLQAMQRSLRNRDDERLAKLRADLRMAKALDAVGSSLDSRAAVATAKHDLQVLQDTFTARREKLKFDLDVTDGERGSAYFFRSPSPSVHRVAIPSVTTASGSLTSDPDAMAAEHRRYWGSVFQSPSRDLQVESERRRYDPVALHGLLEHATARLTDAQRQALDAPITAHDLYWAITKSPTGRSAGYDGLPAEYYQLYPQRWAQVFEMVYANNLERGFMTKSQRKAYISLLFKGGDRSLPSNYRPITLLNHDAKFGSKVLAWRLRTILPTLLHPDQTGFVGGRSIRHALIRFQDLQSLAKRLGWDSAGAVLLDFAKAFDSVLWGALTVVLHHLGFGPIFCSSVLALFKGTLVSVLVNGSASRFFELGCGVRQGDPLSPALFVLFIEPLLCYLRATTGHLGLPVPGDREPHHLLAFADDCTGLLHHLDHAPAFVASVRCYSEAAGLRLNVNKTHLFPFSPLPLQVRDALVTGGWDVVSDAGSVRLLGIHVSPSLPTSSRFPRLLADMVLRCTLWRYRARTLLGRAVILRTIVLPLLWYTAAVTPVPASVALQVKRLCKSFLFKKTISETRDFKGPMAEEWLYRPTSSGGLGLPDPVAFSDALQLCSLRDAMCAVSVSHVVPRWFQPAFILFADPLVYGGAGFDLLYAPIPRGFTLPASWLSLGTFWIGPLRSWYKLITAHCTIADFGWAIMEWPYWQNHFLRANAANRLTGAASTAAHRFYNQGYTRLQDFVDRHGCLPTPTVCGLILGEDNYSRRSQFSRAAGHLPLQVHRLLGLDVSQPPVLGPHLPPAQCAASHGWSFSGVLFLEASNHVLYRLLHPVPTIVRSPHVSLEVPVEPQWETLWRRERCLNRDVLPVLSDVKFRLQHNGLNVRSKYQHRTADVLCVHGCGVVETARHLFWSCAVAQVVWDDFLPELRVLLTGDVEWGAVVYTQGLCFTPSAVAQFGTHNLLRVFNILRCSVLYTLWLHHNDCMMNGAVSDARSVVHRATAYIKLHLSRLCLPENSRLRSLCLLWRFVSAPHHLH